MTRFHSTGRKATRRSIDPHIDEDKTLLDPETTARDQREDVDDSASDDEDITFNWTDEKSILAYLMEEGPKQSDHDRVDALVNGLKEPFKAKSKQLRKEMAETFVPAIQQVHKVNRVLANTVDTDTAKGITTFNNACKSMESATLAEFEELADAYDKNRDNIANLMEQLKAEYAHRDTLWTVLEKKIDDIVEPVLQELQDLPGSIERLIAKLDKGYDAMQNQGKETAAFSEKRLKDLLSKLGDSSLVL